MSPTAWIRSRDWAGSCTRVRRCSIRRSPTRCSPSVGGHPLPLHVSADAITELGAHGPLLGAFPDVQWTDHALTLEPGGTLVAYTDGVTDAQGDGRGRFGLGRLRATLDDHSASSAAQLIAGLAGGLDEFQTGALTDDTAAIAIRRRPRVDTVDGAGDDATAQTGSIGPRA